jgi:L-histidine N-alpha-methyltransferase
MSSEASRENLFADGVAYFVDRKPKAADFMAEVLEGLAKSPKAIPPKFFYDDAGSHLFNAICETPEYYVTRTETSLMATIGPEIAALAGPGRVVVEYGCGSSLKIDILLNLLDKPAEFLGIDISGEHLRQTVIEIARDHPDVRVGGLCADFSGGLDLPTEMGEGRLLAFFPGSTIGNQTPAEAEDFLRDVRATIGDDGEMLIGVDLRKSPDILNPAYNDAAGHTAAFNLNLFHRMVNELGADLDIGSFRHKAFFNEAESRIEMHLESQKAQTILLGDRSFDVADGETIHTENSHKYSIEAFSDLAGRAGFDVRKSWTDKDQLFSIHYLGAK